MEVTMATRYARACGPAVVASVYNSDRETAAKALNALRRTNGKRKRRAATGCNELEQLLSSKFSWIKPENQQVLGEWLYYNGNHSHVILYVSKHFVHVRYGRIKEANGFIPWCAKVKGIMVLDHLS
jgi:hypothetical protein